MNRTLLQALAFLVSFSVLFFGAPTEVRAHESRPALLEIEEVGASQYLLVWKRPARQNAVLKLSPRFPGDCEELSRGEQFVDGGVVVRARLGCQESLSGRPVHIEGLSATLVDVVVLVKLRAGDTQSQVLRGGSDSFVVAQAPSATSVFQSYVAIGVEHILLGIDHLLFVFGLFLTLGPGRRLVWAITSFTLAHSVTLALSSLELVHVAQAPVEAVIALSIVFLASDVVEKCRGRSGWTERRPWTVTFIVGLLHGLGFAGALREVGLPVSHLPLALFSFNFGVELGQLTFLLVVLAAFWLLGKVFDVSLERRRERLLLVGAYALGTLAAFWMFERTVALAIA